MEQIITPNPNISCIPGECKVYVEGTYNVIASGKYPTALSNWYGNPHAHPGELPPDGLKVPMFFTVKEADGTMNSAGHVAESDGSGGIYSSSSSTSHTPIHHPSMAAMQDYWAHGTMLTYLGWTENIEDTLVVKENNMAIIEDNQDWRLRVARSFQTIRGDSHPMSEGEFQEYIGQDFSILIYALQDDPEADANVQAADLGREAQTQNWQQQITDLTAANEALKTVPVTPPEVAPEPVAPPVVSITTTPVTPVLAPVIHATAPKPNWLSVIGKFLKGFFG